MRRIAAVGIALLLAACAESPPGPLQGYAEGEYVRVAAPFAGMLVRLDAARGARVEPGAPLFALEAENEAAARREYEDRVRRAQSQLENLRKGARPTELEALRAQLAQAEAAVAFETKEYARAQDLLGRKFVSEDKVDAVRALLDRDRQRVAEIKAQIATANLGARPDEIRAAESDVAAARALLAQADWRLKQKTVAATVSGLVTDTLYVRGEWVAAGMPVVAILPPENVKVRFYVPEARLGALRTGQGVELACSGCAGPVAATVTYISPQAEYTPPVIYSRENRSRLVFRVEARPAPGEAGKLHPGQPVDVTLR